MVNYDQRLKDLKEFIYYSTSLFIYSNIDDALYDIVCYGPLMVAVFTLLSIYICVDNENEVKLMNI